MHKTLEFNSNYNNNKLTRYNQNGGLDAIMSGSKTLDLVKQLSDKLSELSLIDKINDFTDFLRNIVKSLWESSSDNTLFAENLSKFSEVVSKFSGTNQKGGVLDYFSKQTSNLTSEISNIQNFINSTLVTIIQALDNLIKGNYNELTNNLMLFFDGSLFNQIKEKFGFGYQKGGAESITTFIMQAVQQLLARIEEFDKYGITKIFIPIISFIIFAGSQSSETQIAKHINELIHRTLGSLIPNNNRSIIGGSGTFESVKVLLENFIKVIFLGPENIINQLLNLTDFTFIDFGSVIEPMKRMIEGGYLKGVLESAKTMKENSVNSLDFIKALNISEEAGLLISKAFERTAEISLINNILKGGNPIAIEGFIDFFKSDQFRPYIDVLKQFGVEKYKLIQDTANTLSNGNFNDASDLIMLFINTVVSFTTNSLIGGSLQVNGSLKHFVLRSLGDLFFTIFKVFTEKVTDSSQIKVLTAGSEKYTSMIPNQLLLLINSIKSIVIVGLFISVMGPPGLFAKLGQNKTLTGGALSFIGENEIKVLFAYLLGVLPKKLLEKNGELDIKGFDIVEVMGKIQFGGAFKTASNEESFFKKITTMFLKGINIGSYYEKDLTPTAKTAAIATSIPTSAAAIATAASLAKTPPKIEASKKKELTKKQKEYYKKLENYVLNNDLKEKKKKIKIPKRYDIIYYPLPDSIN